MENISYEPPIPNNIVSELQVELYVLRNHVWLCTQTCMYVRIYVRVCVHYLYTAMATMFVHLCQIALCKLLLVPSMPQCL